MLLSMLGGVASTNHLLKNYHNNYRNPVIFIITFLAQPLDSLQNKFQHKAPLTREAHHEIAYS